MCSKRIVAVTVMTCASFIISACGSSSSSSTNQPQPEIGFTGDPAAAGGGGGNPYVGSICDSDPFAPGCQSGYQGAQGAVPQGHPTLGGASQQQYQHGGGYQQAQNFQQQPTIGVDQSGQQYAIAPQPNPQQYGLPGGVAVQAPTESCSCRIGLRPEYINENNNPFGEKRWVVKCVSETTISVTNPQYGLGGGWTNNPRRGQNNLNIDITGYTGTDVNDIQVVENCIQAPSSITVGGTTYPGQGY